MRWTPLVLLFALACEIPDVDPSLDIDRDGFPWSTDCDDLATEVHPGAPERCDAVDNNCDGYIDEAGAIDAPTWYGDIDNDGYGDAAYPRVQCEAPDHFVDVSGDCDDEDPQINPEGEESCNGADDDCDGTIDDGASDFDQFYTDADNDGFGDENDTSPIDACEKPDGYSPNADDCDDADPGVNPRADEVWYDGVDGDCDNASDYDADGDGDKAIAFGGTDCDDTRAYIRPGRPERCDDLDNDCDGVIDPDTAIGTTTFYADLDEDSYGDPRNPRAACTLPAGYTTATMALDCDDGDPAISPAAAEVWYDGVDQDCDALSDYDADADGFDSDLYGGGDCDDTTASTFPTTWYADVDLDGYGDATSTLDSCASPGAAWSLNTEDCGPADPAVHPGVEEVCGDGIDNNCDDSSNSCGLTGRVAAITAIASYFGERTMDAAGSAIANVGDLDGDGQVDIVVGVDNNDTAGTNSGRAYALHLPITGSASLGGSDTIISPASAGVGFGTEVVGLGDPDADGFARFAISAPGATTSTGDAGVVYLFDGPLDASLDAREASTTLGGVATGDRFGANLAFGQDLDADGDADLLVAADYESTYGTSAGAAYLFAADLDGEHSVDAAFATIYGENTRDYVGSDAALNPDVDGDGLADLVLGAKGYSTGGAVGVFYGPLSGDMVFSDADLLLTGDVSYVIGKAVGAAGDLTGDGLADLILGDSTNDTMGTSAGIAWVTAGDRTGTHDILSVARTTLYGSDSADGLGYSLVGTADLDASGEVDLAIGAPVAETVPDVLGNTFTAGGVFLFLGPLPTGSLMADTQADGHLEGRENADRFGAFVSDGGDTNSDGYGDLLIGGPGSENPAEDPGVGRIFLFLGGPGL